MAFLLNISTFILLRFQEGQDGVWPKTEKTARAWIFIFSSNCLPLLFVSSLNTCILSLSSFKDRLYCLSFLWDCRKLPVCTLCFSSLHRFPRRRFLPLAYNHLLLLFFCSETLAVSALPAVMLEWDLKESVRKEGQGRAAVRYCLQYPLIQWLIPHLPQTLVSPSMSPCLSHLHSCSIANILQSQAPSTRSALPVSSIISPLAVPLRDWTPWGVGLLSPSILFPLQQPLLQGPVIPSGVLTSSQGWMILWDCSGDTASSPRLGARGAHSLLLWPGSHFSVSGDGLAGSGPGLWVLVKFEGH